MPTSSCAHTHNLTVMLILQWLFPPHILWGQLNTTHAPAWLPQRAAPGALLVSRLLGNLCFWLCWLSWRANAIWCVVLILELLIFCVHPAGYHRMMSPAQSKMDLLPRYLPGTWLWLQGARALPETRLGPSSTAPGGPVPSPAPCRAAGLCLGLPKTRVTHHPQTSQQGDVTGWLSALESQDHRTCWVGRGPLGLGPTPGTGHHENHTMSFSNACHFEDKHTHAVVLVGRRKRRTFQLFKPESVESQMIPPQFWSE